MTIGFYRPYKGLKQKRKGASASSYTPSFYRPYKGLKRACLFKTRKQKRSFYRPYKGLKLLISNYIYTIILSFLSSL